MDRLPCSECKQCNRKGKPSVTRLSKYCDTHYKNRPRVKQKKGFFNFFTAAKDKFFDKRAKYNDEGKIEDLNTKGFRKDWFWR